MSVTYFVHMIKGAGDQADPTSMLAAVEACLADCGAVTVACSGGIDSLLLATIAHRRDPSATLVAHTVTPAVPGEGTARVMEHARRNGWNLRVVRSQEFDDERYLANPTDRCYYCKTNLYDAVADVRAGVEHDPGTIVSGANLDDLGEYRPGLIAADEHGVRHPYVEAQVDKAGIRAIAAHLGLAEADLASSPCLASRLYTGTRVTAARLQAIEVGEAIVRAAGMPVARCRIRGTEVLIEVPEPDHRLVTERLVADVRTAMGAVEPSLVSVALDDRPYRPGQAVLHIS